MGTRSHQLNRGPSFWAQLVAGGELLEMSVRDAVLSTALAIGLDEAESRRTIDSAFIAGLQNAQSRPSSERVETLATERRITMTVPLKYAELRRLSEEDLIRRHDAATENVGVGLNYFIEELARRRVERQAAAVENMTATIVRLTKFIAVLTALATLSTLANLAILLSGS